MNILMKLYRNRQVAWLPGILSLLLLAGCLEKNLLWSPDGSRAVVLGEDGLYLTDPAGQLTPLLLPAVYRAAWLGDSKQLVLARTQKTGSWNEIARVLGVERVAAVAARSDALWQKLEAGDKWGKLTAELHGTPGADLAVIHLRDHHGEALRSRIAAGEWTEMQGREVEYHELFLARVEKEGVTAGARLHAGLGNIREIRVAPGDQAVGYVTEKELPASGKGEDELQLWAARLDATAPVLVAARVSTYPDWTPDGRALVFVQAAGGPGRDELRLGTLTQREVFDAKGAATTATEPHELAGWMFSDQARVRCLRDGRILFNAAELSLPIAAEDFGETHEQLFALDPSRQATLTRIIPRKHETELPQSLAFFEVSPDEKQVLFGDLNGMVAVLTLASGEVERVQDSTKVNLQGQPVWRQAGEFSFTRRASAPDAARKAEVVLRKAGKEQVLSASWPEVMVNHLVSDKK